MPNAIIIDLQLKGVQSLVQGVNRSAQSIGSLNGGVNAIGKSVTAQTNALRQNQGPMQRYIASLKRLQDAQRSGSYPAIFDARSAAQRAGNGLRKAQAMLSPTAGSQIGRAAASARLRVGVNGISGGSIGAGQLGNILGPEFAGPVAIAATAVMLLAKAAKIASESLEEYRNAMNRNSTTPGGAREIANIEKAYPGISAKGINEGLQSGGPAAAAVAQITGYHARPGYYGDIDNAKAMDAAIDAIRGAKSDQQAKQIAHGLGQEDLMNFRGLSDDEVARLKTVGGTADAVSDSKRAARDVGSGRGIENIAKLGLALNPARIAYDLIKNAFSWASGGPTAPIFDGDGKKGQKLDKSIDKLTDAMNRNTVEMGKSRSTVGGAERAAGMPIDSWVYHFFAKQQEAHAVALGASRL